MTIVIAAGGTGGHLYPAVALAREFLRRDPMTKILFVGTARGLESKVLAHEGFELALISAKPVMGRGLIDVLKGLLAMPVSLWQCGRILSQRQAESRHRCRRVYQPNDGDSSSVEGRPPGDSRTQCVSGFGQSSGRPIRSAGVSRV